jgi:GNAT superfamily N-acetyltransferase
VAGARVADVTVRPVSFGEAGRFSAELDAHHWLGHRLTGQVLRYVAELDGQWVAVAGFGSAALSCAARDRFIGWSREQQYARLIHIVNNQRFCVLPGGQRHNLASAVLARLLRRLPADYLAAYGHRVLAVETFTDPARHTGACYAAANFRQVGQTLGYGRSAGTWHHHGSPKRVWVYPLHRRAPEILSAPFDHPLLTREEPRVINLNALPLAGDRASLLEVLGGLADPRAKRGIRHQVAATLTMVTAAGLSGCGRSFRSAADFIADLPQEALARLGARYHPVKRRYIAPEESTIRRHVKMIDADQADRLTGGWLLAQVTAGRIAAGDAAALMVALDGKVLKGAWEELRDCKVKLFSALVHGEGVIIGQRGVPQDTTEVTQILPLLDDIAAARQAANADGGDGDHGDLDGVTITAGALHVHRENLQQVTDRGGEYIMTVKGNMPSLERDIAAMFPESPADGGAFPPSPRHR